MKRPYDARTVRGLILTAVWLGIAVGITIWKRDMLDGMKLNEMGDFLAGFFAPLGFLWLVIGYFQQGVELQQNTEALNMQARELQRSVQEQQAMVEATRRQVELLELEQRERRLKESRAHQALFRFVDYRMNVSAGKECYFSACIENIGHSVTHVRVSCSEESIFMGPKLIPQFDKDMQSHISLSGPVGEEIDAILKLSYIDGLGEDGICELSLRMVAPNIILNFRPEHLELIKDS